MQEDGILPTFPSESIFSFHSNKIPTRDNALMRNSFPSPKVFLTPKDALEKETEIKINFLNSLSPKDPIQEILRKVNDLNTCSDSLLPKDE